MRAQALRVVVATVACLLWLNGCESSTRLGDMFQSNTAATQGASQDDPAITGSLPPKSREGAPAAAAPRSSDPNDDVSLGKKYFRAGNFALAERHFRRAVELHPRDVDSWIGLAASYDRQRRFELADRAYDQGTKIAGPTAEILNNRG
ncbi:MAG TPA: tetratricopeptide repeat protein, partial [Xanthobacteraceae bacterium]